MFIIFLNCCLFTIIETTNQERQSAPTRPAPKVESTHYRYQLLTGLANCPWAASTIIKVISHPTSILDVACAYRCSKIQSCKIICYDWRSNQCTLHRGCQIELHQWGIDFKGYKWGFTDCYVSVSM